MAQAMKSMLTVGNENVVDEFANAIENEKKHLQ